MERLVGEFLERRTKGFGGVKGAKPRKVAKAAGPERRGGFLLLYRKLKENPRYKQSGFVQVWIHFLLSARFQPGRELFDGKPIMLKAGQFISSRREIAEATGLSEGMVKRLISDLQVDQQIDQLPGSKHSMFTVLKWAEYQGGDPLVDPQVDPRLTHDRSTTDPRLTHQNQNPQAGVHKNDPNKGTRKQGNNDPKSNLGGGVGVQGKGAASRAQGVFEVPVFEPFPKGIYTRELERAEKAVAGQIKRLKARDDAWEWSEKPDADVVRAIEVTLGRLAKCTDDEQRATLEASLREFEGQRVKRVKVRLLPEAQAALDAWNEQALRIEQAYAGVKR